MLPHTTRPRVGESGELSDSHFFLAPLIYDNDRRAHVYMRTRAHLPAPARAYAEPGHSSIVYDFIRTRARTYPRARKGFGQVNYAHGHDFRVCQRPKDTKDI